MKITDIRAAVRSENRVNVFVEGKYELSLDVQQVVDLKVKVGREISPEELEELRKASEFGKLYQRALEWVLIRPRSRREAEDYFRRRIQKRRTENLARAKNRAYLAELRRAGRKLGEKKLPTAELPEIDQGLVELVLARLSERGYLDDERFARYYVENRFVKKGVSRKRLELELRKKGVVSETIDTVLAESGRDEREEIKKIVAKKIKKYGPKKMLAYLVRQGFDYELSRELVAEVCEEEAF